LTKWPPVNDVGEKSLLLAYRKGHWGKYGRGTIEEFESRFASFQGCRFAVAVSSGTTALYLAYLATGLARDDWFVSPSYTFISTVTSGVVLGARPVFVDVDPETLNLDPESLRAELEKNRDGTVRAVVPVHFSGIPAEIDQILGLKRSFGFRLVEDAAQAHGAEYRGKRVGGFGDAGIFSFQSSKNITSGEGGAVVTNKEDIYRMVWSLSDMGRRIGGAWYEHFLIGWNFRITELQASLLLSQLETYNKQFEMRRKNAQLLVDLLGKSEWYRPVVPPPHVKSSNHLLPIWIDTKLVAAHKKEEVVKRVREKGGGVGEGYPLPVHRQPAMKDSYWRLPDYSGVNLPITEEACRRVVWVDQVTLLSEKSTRQTASALISVAKELAM
jgi:dTDP-4-amino-4,6-dideoxygalactose transaminase